MGNHAEDAQHQSLVRWATAILPGLEDQIRAFREKTGEVRTQGSDDQVATKGLVDSIAFAEAELAKAQAIAHGIFARFVAWHPRPFERARNPRTSVAAEVKVDHGYTKRDM